MFKPSFKTFQETRFRQMAKENVYCVVLKICSLTVATFPNVVIHIFSIFFFQL